MQDELGNLRDLLKADISDITGYITNSPSVLVDFERFSAQFAVGGTTFGLAGVSLDSH